jgi:YspA, cpYpsA-related SLOG family
VRVLVCGGRRYLDRDRVFRELDDLHAQQPITLLIHGGAKGADRSAEAWAMSRGVGWRRFLADFKTLGKAAGPLRNAKMLAEGRPDLVVAFPGQRGTADMTRRAYSAGLPVVRIEGANG